MSDETNKRRWQFTIRDVLLTMVIVALAVSWYVDHQRLSDELARQRLNWIWLGSNDRLSQGHNLNLLNFTTGIWPTAISGPDNSNESLTDPPPSALDP